MNARANHGIGESDSVDYSLSLIHIYAADD